MIFVTVGTSSWRFDRLVREMDRISGLTSEEVVIQYGASSVRLANAKGYDYLSPIEMDGLFNAARLIVAHAGSGTIIRVLKMGKPIIVVPRASANEAYDDHQIELARALEDDSRIRVVYETSKLEFAIGSLREEAMNMEVRAIHRDLADRLRDYLNSIDGGRSMDRRIDEPSESLMPEGERRHD